MKPYFYFGAFLIFGAVAVLPSVAAAQSDTLAPTAVVVADSRVEILSKKQAQINKLSVYKNSAGQYKGYRVMIINTNNRELAYKLRNDILRYFPDKNVYLAYQAPYFKLKAGDFTKKEEAEKFKKSLSKYFSESLYVISDIVKLTAEEEAKLLLEKEENQY